MQHVHVLYMYGYGIYALPKGGSCVHAAAAPPRPVLAEQIPHSLPSACLPWAFCILPSAFCLLSGFHSMWFTLPIAPPVYTYPRYLSLPTRHGPLHRRPPWAFRMVGQEYWTCSDLVPCKITTVRW